MISLLIAIFFLPTFPAAAAETGCTCTYITTGFNNSDPATQVVTTASTGPITNQTSCTLGCTEWANTKTDSIRMIASYVYVITEAIYLTEAESASATAAAAARTYLRPSLNVDIPGLNFAEILKDEFGNLHINFIPEYLNGLYRYALGAGAIIAIVMVMIGGAQYMIGSGMGSVEAGKKRITNAVTGLILLLSAYTMLYLINPDLTTFEELELAYVNPNLFVIKYATDEERKSSCKDRTQISLTESPMTDRAALTIPPASSCPKTVVSQTQRDLFYQFQKSSGIPAATMLGQMILERGAGKPCLGTHQFNCFGIKCASGGSYAGMDTLVSSETPPTCPANCNRYQTNEVVKGVNGLYWACFQDFATFDEAAEKYQRIVQDSGWERYAGNPETFAKFVQNNCYATGLNYANSVIAVMKQQCLYTP